MQVVAFNNSYIYKIKKNLFQLIIVICQGSFKNGGMTGSGGVYALEDGSIYDNGFYYSDRYDRADTLY